MTKLENRIADLEQRRARFEHLIPVCEGAGYNASTLRTPEDIFWLHTAITRDPYLKALAYSPEFLRREDKLSVIEPDFVGALESMSEAERAALRSRLNFCPTPKSFTRERGVRDED